MHNTTFLHTGEAMFNLMQGTECGWGLRGAVVARVSYAHKHTYYICIHTHILHFDTRAIQTCVLYVYIYTYDNTFLYTGEAMLRLMEGTECGWGLRGAVVARISYAHKHM